MVYVDWLVEDKKSIIFKKVKYFLIGLLIILFGLFGKSIMPISADDNYLQVQIFFILIGFAIIVITALSYIIQAEKVEEYSNRLEEIKKNGKKTTGKIIKVKRKHYLSFIEFLKLLNPESISEYPDFLYSVIIEYKSLSTSKIRRVKTPYDDWYTDLEVGDECELIELDDDVIFCDSKEVMADEDFADEIKKKGKKIPATIVKATISSSRCNDIVVKYIDPKSKKKKLFTYEIDFNPRRLESNKCTLYKWNNELYLDDFILGNKKNYNTDKSIDIHSFLKTTEEAEKDFKLEQKITIASLIIFLCTILLLFIIFTIMGFN